MTLISHKILMDGLILIGWGFPEIYRFIEENPNIWLQALQIERLLDAVGHIEMFLATAPEISTDDYDMQGFEDRYCPEAVE